MRLREIKVVYLLVAILGGCVISSVAEASKVKVKNGIILPADKKREPLTIEWVKVPDFGWSPFVIVKFSRSIAGDIQCGNPRFGTFNHSEALLNALQNASEAGTPVEVELASQPCQTIEEFNYLAVKYIKFFGKKYLPDGVNKNNSKPLGKGSKKKFRINPTW